MNPVRAGLVRDPKDYRWSGYGEAVAGKARAREGLTRLDDANWDDGGTESWRSVHQVYRCWLYGDERERLDDEGKVTKRGFSAEASEAVIEREEGALARGYWLRRGSAISAKGWRWAPRGMWRRCFASGANSSG